MLLRSVTKHVKDQNWFAVFLDFIIVVFGVYIGLQVQGWANEKNRLNSEQQYLQRLHDEVQQLADTRAIYDDTRKRNSKALFKISELINEEDSETSLSDEQCRTIAHSSYTTIPPAELPSATELISSGRLDQIASAELRNSILRYIQDVARVRDLISAISDSNIDLSRTNPELIKVKLFQREYMRDTVDLIATCDVNALRQSPAFINDFNNNAYMYVVYTERGVLKVSQKLAELHTELDKVLEIKHPTNTNDKEDTP